MMAPLGVPAETSTVSGPPGLSTLNDPPMRHGGIRHRHFDVEVVVLAAKHRVRAYVHDDVQVARRAAERAVFALAVQPQPLAVGDAGGDPDGHPAVARDAAGSRGRPGRAA